MNRPEDIQPGESIHGRPKSVLPSIKDTSRGARRKARGTRPARQGERGPSRGPGLGHGTSVAGISRPHPHYATGSNTFLIPSKSHRTWPSHEESAKTTKSIKSENPAATDTVNPGYPSTQPRGSFIPTARGRPRSGDSPTRRNNVSSSPSRSQIDPNSKVTLSASGPPAKRPRLDGLPTMKPIAKSATAKTNVAQPIKLEASEPPPNPNSVRLDGNSGCKFISYDRYPKCRFDSGLRREEVFNIRKSIKEEAVQELQKQGLKIDAVRLRDDGIAIDWTLPTSVQSSELVSGVRSLISGPEQYPSGSRDNIVFSLPLKEEFIPPPEPVLWSRLGRNIAYILSFQQPNVHDAEETAYREIPIPTRCLSAIGDNGELEKWIVERINQLKAELRSVIIPTPELVGIDEHLVIEHSPDGLHPYLRIRYRYPSPETSTSQAGELNAPRIDIEETTILPGLASTMSCAHPASLTIPATVHPSQPPSPAPRDNVPTIIKSEDDELSIDPPSLCVLPVVALMGSASNCTAHTSCNAIDSGHQTTSTVNGGPKPASGQESDMDEIYRLRRDLEASRLEAERKHRELERRITELAQKRMPVGLPEAQAGSNATPCSDQAARVADESKSTIIVLRKGKHDETRRLLSHSLSTTLHISWLGTMQLVDQSTRRVLINGFDKGVPDGASVEDACLLSESSVALALSSDASQLGIATIGKKTFSYCSLPRQPHDARGICTVAPINPSQAITLGHDRSFVHWRFDQNGCSTNQLHTAKLHQCTALVYDSAARNIIFGGSDYRRRGKMGIHSLYNSYVTHNLVDFNNHVHHIYNDPDHPNVIILELSRLDEQFQVHDMRLPLHQSVQRFGYQTPVYEKGSFRIRGGMSGYFFSRGDVGIVRAWDRRNPSKYQTISVIPQQKVVDVVLTKTSLICATKSHQLVSYPML